MKRFLVTILLLFIPLLQVSNKIIKTDDRVMVNNRYEQPYTSIVRIKAYFHDEAQNKEIIKRGTGFMIDNNSVLTAGHAVYSKFGLPYKTEVLYSKNYSNSLYKVKALDTPYINENYLKTEGSDYDWAVFDVEESIGETIGYFELDTEVKAANSVTVTGYKEDLNDISLYTMTDIITDTLWSPHRFEYFLDTSEGQSGAPVYNEDNQVIGIHIGTKSDKYLVNVAKKITPELKEFLLENYIE